jgi:hypothetical protein
MLSYAEIILRTGLWLHDFEGSGGPWTLIQKEPIFKEQG